jgi:hypothetical protein
LNQPDCGVAGTPCCAADACEGTLTCVDGACGCGGSQTACGNACIDTATDPAHCGSCNHDCLGGGCELGVCQPVLLTETSKPATVLALSGNEILWGTDGSAIAKRAVGPGGSVTDLVAAQYAYSGLVHDGTFYWANDWEHGEIRSCQVAGCNSSHSVFYSYSGTARAFSNILHDKKNGQIIWGTFESSAGAKDANLGARSFAGVDRPLASGLESAIPSAVDDTFVYWLEWRKPTVNKTPLVGGDTIPLVTGLSAGTRNNFGGMVVADRTLFVARGGTIYKVALPNGVGAAEPPVFTTTAPPMSLHADATHLYWADYADSGSISRCPLSGCEGAPEIVAPGQAYIREMVIDDVAVYWSVSAGKIMKVAK